jgi:hypothetical protein
LDRRWCVVASNWLLPRSSRKSRIFGVVKR